MQFWVTAEDDEKKSKHEFGAMVYYCELLY